MEKELTFSPRTITNTFKKHFANLASEKSLKSFLSLQDDLEYLQCVSITRELTSVKKKLTFEKLCSVSILKILKKLKTNKATVVDNLTWRFLKDDANIFFTPIARLCNISIKFNFSQINKKSQKLSLCIKGFKTKPKNFRSILLFPLISKIIERILYDQTMNSLSHNNVMYKYQSGFLIFHPTESCLSYYLTKSKKVSNLVSWPEWFLLIYKRHSTQLTTTS